MGVFIGWCGTKFEIFRKKFGFFGTVKNANFSVQTIEFVFKQSNFNSNGSITSRRITTVRRPQQQAVVRAVLHILPSATARPGSSARGTI
jgi:hypothetical protein